MLSQVLYCAQPLVYDQILPNLSLIKQKFEEDPFYPSYLEMQLHDLVFKALPLLSTNNYQAELLQAFLTEVDKLFRERVN
jgi:hypothetical protein